MIKFSLIITAILLSACSSAPTKSAGAVAIPEKALKISVVSMDATQASQSLCANNGQDLSKKNFKYLIELGNSCVRMQEFARLEEVGAALNKAEPYQPWGSYYLSLAAEARNEIPTAKWMIELAIKKNSSYGILYFQKGRVMWLDKQYAEAINLVKKAIEMDPGLVEGHLFLGQVYFRDQEFDLASEHFYVVLKAKPYQIEALSGLAESRRYRGDYRGAMEVLNRAISNYPDAIEFQWRQAQIYETNLDDKINALNTYIKLKRKLLRSPSKIISLADVENKIQEIEKQQRKPAVSSAKSPGKEGVGQ